MTEEDRVVRRRRKLRHSMEVLMKHKGVVKAAAHELGVSERTLSRQVGEFCEIEGYVTPLEAAYSMGRDRVAA